MMQDVDAVESLANALQTTLQPLSAIAVFPPVLQPAGLYLELVGEEIRRSALLTQSDELCLRPDMTIPAARMALGFDRWSAPGFAVRYDGPVFRRLTQGPPQEPRQLGVEWYAPQAECPRRDLLALQTAVDACRAVGVPIRIEFGCAGLVDLLLKAAGASEAVSRAVRRGAGSFEPVQAVDRGGALGEALAHLSPERAAEALAELLQAAGVETIPGRSLAEVAERLRTKARNAEGAEEAKQAFALVSGLLEISGEPFAALDRLSKAAAKLDRPEEVQERIDALRALWAEFSAAGEPPSSVFRTGFRRAIGYYDGFAFDLRSMAGALVGGGGRYDRALPALAAAEQTLAKIAGWGAVGFSLSVTALAEVAR